MIARTLLEKINVLTRTSIWYPVASELEQLEKKLRKLDYQFYRDTGWDEIVLKLKKGS